MKKLILTAGLAALLMGSASAAEPTTLTDKADKLDEVIFGEVQQGSFLERVSAMDEAVYGGTGEGEGLDGRVSDLYRDVIRDESSSQPSLSTRVNTLEYYLTDEIKQDALESRVEMLESTVFGVGKTGALDVRVNELERAVYGNTHFELVTVTLPADTVFKISLNEEISSKVNMEGDIVHFTVQEDVLQDGVLVLPRGAQGSGVVTKVSRPKFFGRSGSLEISFNQVFSIDAEEIPTVLGPESQEKLKMEAAAVGASAVGALALGPIGLVGGLFVKGKDVEMPAGTELYIQTQQAVETHGMKQAEGAPKAVVHKKVGTAAAVTMTETVEKTAVAPAETAAPKTEAAESTAASAPAETTAAAETVEETTSEKTDTEETGEAAAPAEDEPSVVIVRHE